LSDNCLGLDKPETAVKLNINLMKPFWDIFRNTPPINSGQAARLYRQQILNLLAAFLLILIPIIEIAYYLFAGPESFNFIVLYLSIGVMIALGGILALNARGYLTIASYLLVISFSAAIFLGLSSFSGIDRAFFYGYLILPIILASILFSKRYILFTAILEIIVLIALSLTVPEIRLQDTPIFLILTATALLTFITHLRNLVEIERNKLTENEDRQFRMLIEEAPEAILVYDVQDSVVTMINRHLLKLFGYQTLELIRKYTAPDLRLPLKPTDDIQAYILRAMQGEMVTFDIMLRHFEGHRFLCAVTLNHIPNQGRDLIKATIRDVQKQRDNEKALAAYTQRLEALHRIDTAILGANSALQIGEAALENLKDLIEYDRASVTVYEGPDDELYFYLLAVSGIQKDAIPAHTRIKVDDRHFIYRMRETRSIVYTKDLLEKAELNSSQQMLKDAGQRSILNLPIIVQDELIGALNISSKAVDAFSGHDIENVSVVARQLAIALQQASLFESLEERARQLEAVRKSSLILTQSLELEEVLQTILKVTLDLVKSAEFAHLILYRDGRFTREIAQDIYGNERFEVPPPRPGGFTEHIVNLKEIDWIANIADSHHFADSDERWKGCLVGLPLLIGEQVVGVMNIYYPEPQSYDPQQSYVLRMISDHAAIAIQNARLFEAERRARELQNAIFETTQSVSSSLDLEEILDTLLTESANVLPFVSSSVLRYQNGRVYFLAVNGRNQINHLDLEAVSQNMAGGQILQALIEEQNPLVFDDVRDVEGWIQAEGTQYIRSWMGIPLIAGGQFIGIWNIDHDQVGVYTEEHLRIAQALAAAVASALQNARLFETQQLALAQTNTLLDLAQSVTATLELNETLDQFLSGSRNIIEFASSMILYLRDGNFIPIAMSGFEDEEGVVRYFERYQHEPEKIPLFHRLITEREPILIDDVTHSESWTRITQLPDVRSWMGIPLKVRGEFIGVWMIDHYTPNFYSEDHLRLAIALAGPAAIAIQNAQFYQQQGQYTEELERRVQQRTQALELTNNELEAFAYSVSHDLRAPLRAMDGFAAILKEEYLGQLDQEGQIYLNRIAEAAQRMDTLIHDLLIYSRISREEIHLLPVSLEPLVQEVAALLENEITAHAAQINVESPLPILLAQRSVIQQVLINLVSNAIKFTREGEKPIVVIRGHEDNGQATISVVDNGIGIAPEHYDRIFQVFERLHGIETFPGTGIGLAIVKKGIERLDGEVGVKSNEKKGSEFWFKLPTGDLTQRDQD
jgi:PAS domain S-box-containing protein